MYREQETIKCERLGKNQIELLELKNMIIKILN